MEIERAHRVHTRIHVVDPVQAELEQLLAAEPTILDRGGLFGRGPQRRIGSGHDSPSSSSGVRSAHSTTMMPGPSPVGGRKHVTRRIRTGRPYSPVASARAAQ